MLSSRKEKRFSIILLFELKKKGQRLLASGKDYFLCTYPLVYDCKVYTAQEISPEHAPRTLQGI